MPRTTIDGITIDFKKPYHIRNHFDVAIQVRAYLQGRYNKIMSFNIWNNGSPEYNYTVQNPEGAWKIRTKKVYIDSAKKLFKNVVVSVEDLLTRSTTKTLSDFRCLHFEIVKMEESRVKDLLKSMVRDHMRNKSWTSLEKGEIRQFPWCWKTFQQ